jgi:iron complex outermembrane receptor protein
LHHSTGIIELGDLALDKVAVKLSTTVQKNGLISRLRLNPFINSIGNFMFLRPVGFENNYSWCVPGLEYQQTNARLAGVDVTHWKMSEQWQHDFALYVNGRDITNKESLIDIPPLNLSNKFSFLKGMT